MAKRRKSDVLARGGKVVAPKKIPALKSNAPIGSWTPRFAIGDEAEANDLAPADYRGRTGRITEVGPGDNEYRVEFEDGDRPTTGYLRSGWLNPA